MGIETPKGFIDLEGIVRTPSDTREANMRLIVNIKHIISVSKNSDNMDGEVVDVVLTDGRRIRVGRAYKAFIDDLTNAL